MFDRRFSGITTRKAFGGKMNPNHFTEDEAPVRRVKWGRVLFFALVLCIGIYVGTSAQASAWVSETVVQPAIRWFQNLGSSELSNPTPTITPQDRGAVETKEIDISGFTMYAIQTGLFNEKTNATMQGDELQKQGFAGYTLEDSGFRVLAAVYESQESAKQNMAKLQAEKQLECIVYEIKAGDVTMQITAPQKDIQDIQQGVDWLRVARTKLKTLSESLKTKTVTVGEALVQLRSMKAELEVIQSALQNLAVKSPVIDGLKSLCADIAADFENTIQVGENDEKALYAQVNYLIVQIADRCAKYINDI